MKFLQNEKKLDVLLKFSETLKKQKKLIFNDNDDLMIKTLNQTFNTDFSQSILDNMQNGISVNVDYWLCIWIYFQNIDDILISYDVKELGFLMKQPDFANIEQELLDYHKKILND